jgi:hypothetical protein
MRGRHGWACAARIKRGTLAVEKVRYAVAA